MSRSVMNGVLWRRRSLTYEVMTCPTFGQSRECAPVRSSFTFDSPELFDERVSMTDMMDCTCECEMSVNMKLSHTCH